MSDTMQINVADNKYFNLSCYSDVKAYEVLDISDNLKTIKVRLLDAERSNLDKDVRTPGGFACHTEHPDGQQWEFSSNEDFPVETFTLRKNGKYVRKGMRTPPYSAGCGSLSEAPYKYYDYNF